MAHELSESEFVEQPDLAADQEVVLPDFSFDGGDGSAEETKLTVVGDPDDGELGVADISADSYPERSLLLDAPDLDELVITGIDDAAQQRQASKDGLPDEAEEEQLRQHDELSDRVVTPPEETEEAVESPKVQHIISFDEDASVRAAVLDGDGEVSRLEGRVTNRGKDKELAVDGMLVRPDHLHGDVPVELLSRVADECRARGIPTIDSTVGSVRALEVRAQVFGLGALQFHDPGAVGGDKDLDISAEVAAAYLEPGDRAPLHVRAFLSDVQSPSELAQAEPELDSETVAAIFSAITQIPPEVPGIPIDEDISVDAPDFEDDEDGEVAANGTILNEASFSAFYDAQYGAVEKFLAAHFGLSPEDTQDVAQTAFMRAWKSRGSFDGTNPSGWIKTIAANHAKTRFSADQRGPQQEPNAAVSDRALEIAPDKGPLPDVQAITSLDSDGLAQLYKQARITGPQAQVLLLKHGYSLTESEIGRRLGIPRGTVASRNFRALEKLHRELRLQELRFKANANS